MENICILNGKTFLYSCSTDESLTPSYNLLTAHSSHHQPSLAQVQLQSTAITSSSIPHNMSNNLYQPAAMQTGSSGIVQSSSHTQPLEQLAYTEEFFPPTTAGMDEQEQYIYVTYPTEMKKRLSDRYDKETLLLLTNDHGYGEF